MPDLHLVMGPNGAGKSTFGRLFVKNAHIYNPDKELIDIENRINLVSDQTIKKMQLLLCRKQT